MFFELPRNSGYDTNLCFLGQSRSPDADGSRCESWWYTYDFYDGLVRCVEAAAELG